MDKYLTGQRKLLMDFLKEHKDRQLSVDEITESLCTANAISVSAVYRNIDKLVQQGLVQKSACEGSKSRGFLYRYVNDTECSEHLHMKCTKCGCIFHMDDRTTGLFLKLAESGSSFRIDEKKTILYGMCGNCL